MYTFHKRNEVYTEANKLKHETNSVMNNLKKLSTVLSNQQNVYKNKLGISKLSTITQTAQMLNQIFMNGAKINSALNNFNIPFNADAGKIENAELYVSTSLENMMEQLIVSSNLSKLVSSSMEQEVKKKLYKEVHKVIQDTKIEKYTAQKNQLMNQKLGFFDRILGKQAVKDAQIKNLNLKIALVQQENPPQLENYSVREMLADMYACSITELGGTPSSPETGFSPQMTDLFNRINNTFSNSQTKQAFSRETIMAIANQKMAVNSHNLPIKQESQKGFFGRNRATLNMLNTQNSLLIHELINKPQTNFVTEKLSPQQLQLNNKLNLINKTFSLTLSNIEHINIPDEKSKQENEPTIEL